MEEKHIVIFRKGAIHQFAVHTIKQVADTTFVISQQPVNTFEYGTNAQAWIDKQNPTITIAVRVKFDKQVVKNLINDSKHGYKGAIYKVANFYHISEEDAQIVIDRI